jgi:type II secretory pathway pseudopilin PulG
MTVLTRRFNFIELAAVLLVVGIIAYALLTRTLRYLEVAEKAAMTVTVLEIERGIRVRLALAKIQGLPPSAGSLLDANPFEFARATPPNYLGEFKGVVDLDALKRGNWFFTTDRREVTYLPRLTSRFKSADDSPVAVVRYRLEAGDGRTTLPRLVPVTPFLWEPEYGTF